MRAEVLAAAVLASLEVVLVAVAARVLVGWPPLSSLLVVLVPPALAIAAAENATVRARGSALLGATVRLGALVVAAVAAVTVIAIALGRPPSHDERDWLAASMLAAAAAAISYPRVGRRLARATARMLPPPGPAPDELVDLLELRRSQGVRLDDLLTELAEALRTSLGLRSVEWWSGAAGVYERVASSPPRPPARLVLGEAQEKVLARMRLASREWLSVWLPELPAATDGDALAATIAHGGELVGFVAMEHVPGGERDVEFEPAAHRVVPELCHRIGPLLQNARLDSALRESLDEIRRQSAALARSRSRVVHAADDERRRIERNLHDGLQQRLVAVTLQVRLARELSGGDRARAEEIMERLEADLELALEELRALAHGVYPPALRDRGLQPVLTGAARRASLPTRVSVETTRRHDPDVEATVYFCCLEAINNACKHAGPDAAITVRVWEQAASVVFEVADDGRGFTSREPEGIGLVNLEDRVGARGGTLAIESAPGLGTRVRGAVPTTAREA